MGDYTDFTGVEPVQLLGEDGTLQPTVDLSVSHDDLLNLYQGMQQVRAFDQKAVSLQRQGRMGTYAPAKGQEAAQIGSSLPLQEEDWIVPSYRDQGAVLTHGLPPEQYARAWLGAEHGNAIPDDVNVLPIAVPVGSQPLHAVGMGYATDYLKDDNVVLTYFGDGATSQGDVHEAWNFAGVWDTPTVFFCNNNQWAISVPRDKQTASPTIAQKAVGYGFEGIQIDGMDPLAVHDVTQAALEKARNPGTTLDDYLDLAPDAPLFNRGAPTRPTLIEAVQYRLGAHTTADDPTKYRNTEEVEHWERKDPITRLETYLLHEDLLDDDMIAAIEADAKQYAKQAFTRAEDAVAARDLSTISSHVYADPVPVDTISPSEATQSLTLVEAVQDALHTEMQQDNHIVVLGEDVGTNGGVFRATDGLLDTYGEDRVIDTPLAESGIAGTGIGMALQGLKPVVEMQFSGFMPPAFDQITSHAARMRHRSQGQYTVPLTIRAPFGAGVRAPEHHSESPEAWYVHQPGLKVAVPSTPYDAKGMLATAIHDPDPVIFLEPKQIYRSFREDVPEDSYQVPLGEAAVRREGDDIAVYTYGAMTQPTLDAADQLAEQGIEAEVVDLRSLSPLDIDTITTSFRKTGRAAVVHEAPKTGGLGAEILATLDEETLLYQEAPIKRITGADTPVPLGELEEAYLPSVERIMDGIIETMEF